VRLQRIVQTSQEVRGTRSRQTKIQILSGLLRDLEPQHRSIVAPWLAGVVPEGRLGFGTALLGRLTAVAPASDSTLTVDEVAMLHRRVKALSGPGSGRRREEDLGRAWARATADEQRFLAALWLGELRQGALESLMVEAIASAASVDPVRVRRAQMLTADLGRVADLALQSGAAGLRGLSLQLFHPVQPMLAQSAETVAEAFDALEDPWIEQKLDGARVQVHKRGDDVRLYTRRLHEVTAARSDLVAQVRRLRADSAILDAEAIALREDGRPHPFQTTMSQFGRRSAASELPLHLFVFDGLQVDGQDLMDEPARERLRMLTDVVPDALRPWRLDHPTPDQAQAFLTRCFDAGHEGAMMKSGQAPYDAGRRGGQWLKLKQAYTADLVVIAVEWGSGRRRGWLSNLHLAAPDADGRPVMVGKTFKGLTDADLERHTQLFSRLEVAREGPVVVVGPSVVVEIAFSEVQASSQYPGGIALRFARFKGLRPDKSPSEATPLSWLASLREESDTRA
jgi:DNA ligase-1